MKSALVIFAASTLLVVSAPSALATTTAVPEVAPVASSTEVSDRLDAELLTWRQATDALAQASDVSDQARERLKLARGDEADALKVTGEVARRAYREGTGMALSPTADFLLSGSDRDVTFLASLQQAAGVVSSNYVEAVQTTEDASVLRVRAVNAEAEAKVQEENLAVSVKQLQETYASVLADEAAAAAKSAADAAATAAAEQSVLTQVAAPSLAGLSAASPGPSNWGGYENGQIPQVALCALTSVTDAQLRCDAAIAFDAMSASYQQTFAEPICLTDSYRSRAAQEAVRIAKPTLAAVPGTSEHGWGLAVDLCGGVDTFGTEEHTWLEANAAFFGWDNPDWASDGGSKEEPWHWEYQPLAP